MMKIDHISPSQINTFMRCAMIWYFRYIEKLIIPPPSAMVFGRQTHKCIEFDNRSKLEGKGQEKLTVLQDMFAEGIEKEPEVVFDEGETKDKLKDEGTQKIIPLYHKELSPRVEPMLVESPFELSFESVDWRLKGVIDLVDMQENIVDYKTTKRTPAEKETLIPDGQLTAYSLGFKILKGHLPHKTRLDYLIRTKEPKTLSLSETIKLKDIDTYLKICSQVVNAIKKEIFIPNPNCFMCSKKGCGYWSVCQRRLRE